jgi:signal transduction histidine kinase
MSEQLTARPGVSRMLPIVTTIVNQPKDWIAARQRSQLISAALGFSPQDQARIATAVSEIARNAFEYAKGGKVEFIADPTTTPQMLVVQISDSGPGIVELERILAGRYRSPHGLGIGITGSRRMMDEFDIDTRIGEGTNVVLKKCLPRSAPAITPAIVGRIAQLLSVRPVDPLEEAQHYNQELLQTLEELGRVNRELKAANEAKDLFLATVSHELRTPMTSILGWVQLLSLSSLEAATRGEGMRAIESAARVQARLIEDILDAARAQSGKLAIELADLDMCTVIESMWPVLQPAVTAKSIVLVKNLGDKQLPIRGDLTRLQQIIWNLVSNAVKFTPEGGTIIVRASSDEDAVTIAVTDSGEGISADLLPHVFKRFTQGENSRQHGGMGLGLAIVDHLVQLHGGTIVATSEGAGMGACFTIRLPLR